MDVCLLWVLRSLRRAVHLSRGVLPSMVRRCVWSRNLVNDDALAHWGAVIPKTNMPCVFIRPIQQQSFIILYWCDNYTRPWLSWGDRKQSHGLNRSVSPTNWYFPPSGKFPFFSFQSSICYVLRNIGSDNHVLTEKIKFVPDHALKACR